MNDGVVRRQRRQRRRHSARLDLPLSSVRLPADRTRCASRASTSTSTSTSTSGRSNSRSSSSSSTATAATTSTGASASAHTDINNLSNKFPESLPTLLVDQRPAAHVSSACTSDGSQLPLSWLQEVQAARSCPARRQTRQSSQLGAHRCSCAGAKAIHFGCKPVNGPPVVLTSALSTPAMGRSRVLAQGIPLAFLALLLFVSTTNDEVCVPSVAASACRLRPAPPLSAALVLCPTCSLRVVLAASRGSSSRSFFRACYSLRARVWGCGLVTLAPRVAAVFDHGPVFCQCVRLALVR
jgi:hypothetical protein